MSDATRCRTTAAEYGQLAKRVACADLRRAYTELEQLWLEMAWLCDALVRTGDEETKRAIYGVVDRISSCRERLLRRPEWIEEAIAA